mmetsp:Transcript_99583/g.321063  ORF Transcript_99583/g.321063 Transcript_99583/m.321063 type:complete len:164 (+) Transcript_99583:77-568(+)
MGANCGSARRRSVDLPMELTYAADGGGPMISMYYSGAPPEGSVGCLLSIAQPQLLASEAAPLDIYLWDVSDVNTADWRNGLCHFGIPANCQLPAIVIHGPSRTYRQALKTLQGAHNTRPDNVLHALKEAWPRELPDETWDALSEVLGAKSVLLTGADSGKEHK